VNPRHRIYIIGASILLHIVLLLLWEGAIHLKLIQLDIVPPPPVEDEPIVFDLQPPNLPREVIETPNDAKVVEQQKKANFLSDKNALARNPETNPNLDIGEPFARGIFESHDLPAARGIQGQQQQQVPEAGEAAKTEGAAEKEPLSEPTENLLETDVAAIYREYERQRRERMKQGIQDRLPTVLHDNQVSRALDQGGLSFNTYNWDFAPYLLALKNRIRRNIFPPAAFTHLGLISGETLLRFKIYPNGQLRDLEILGYEGHESLMRTSSNAVEASAPFPELPPDFPEPYLEVTGKFMYLIHRQKQ
jgi:outer membrane biosynthesis protein TonB